MVRPTAGSLGLAGRPVTDRSVWAEVGYLVETPSAYPDLTVRENLEVARRLRRLRTRSVVDEAVDRFGLGPYARSKARTLSLGNAQRLGLAKALLHRAPDPGAGRTGQRAGPGRRGRDPRAAHRPRPRRRGHRPAVQPPAVARWRGSRPGSASCTTGRLVEELDSTTLEASTRTRLEVGEPGRGSGGRDPARRTGSRCERRPPTPWLLEGRAVLHPEEVATALVEGGEPPTRLVVVDEDLEDHFMRLVGHHADRHGRHPMSAELWAAVGAELIKVRRAVMLWATVVAFVVAALRRGVLHVRAAGPGAGTVAGPAGRQGAAQRRHGRLARLLRACRADGRRRRDAAVRDDPDLAVRSGVRRPHRQGPPGPADLAGGGGRRQAGGGAGVEPAADRRAGGAQPAPRGACWGCRGWSTQVLVHGVGVIVADRVPDRRCWPPRTRSRRAGAAATWPPSQRCSSRRSPPRSSRRSATAPGSRGPCPR